MVAESTFNILRLSSIVGIFILVWSSKLKSQTLGRSDHWFPRNSTSFQAFYLVRSPGLKFKIWGRSDQQFLRYSTFIFWGLLPFVVSSFKASLILVWSPEHKFKVCRRSDHWLLRYSTFNILRMSSIGGRHSLEVFFISSIFYLLWSPELKFKKWERSVRWLLKYSTFNVLRSSYNWRSSYIGDCLYFKHIQF